MTIDLRSDTVTKPCKEMKEVMLNAPLGDDVFGEDPTVLELEKKAAEMFGMSAAIFCPSGTMTNQIAIKLHTRPLDEIITDKLAHIYNYEVGGYAYHSGVSVKTIDGDRGRVTPKQVEMSINPNYDWLPKSSLLVIENTCNNGGGSYYQIQDLKDLRVCCVKNNLFLHMDGARIFNALIETNDTPKEIGNLFDTISVCLSKGLGAPVGSLLMGKESDIKSARRVRKVMGGGMRQSGMLAAAGIFALDNNISKLKEDHRRAKLLGEALENSNFVESVLPFESNILIFKLKEEYPGDKFIAKLAENDVKAIEFGPQMVRFVTHLDFTDDMLERTIAVLKNLEM